MKRIYVKPWISVDCFEVKASILEMSYGGDSGDEDPKDSDARERYYFQQSNNDRSSRRGYGSYGSGKSGWGSLW